MAEVLFFILGALFCLALLAAVLALLPNASQAPNATVTNFAPKFDSGFEPSRPASPRRSGKKTAYRSLPPPSSFGTGRGMGQKKEREAYRLMASLDRVEAVLAQISRMQEPAAAKIAGQTLKRMRSGEAPAPARLAFALNRLELLSLRPDPMARQAARRVLNSLV